MTDLKILYECLEYVRNTAGDGIVFPPVALNKASVLVACSDASWASARCLKSQFGVAILLCPAQLSQTTCNGFLLDWKSGRSPRVCRSTLASEACAADEAADRSSFANLMITELLHQKKAFKGDQKMKSFLCTDAKSLFDALEAENPNLSGSNQINTAVLQHISNPMGPNILAICRRANKN